MKKAGKNGKKRGKWGKIVGHKKLINAEKREKAGKSGK